MKESNVARRSANHYPLDFGDVITMTHDSLSAPVHRQSANVGMKQKIIFVIFPSGQWWWYQWRERKHLLLYHHSLLILLLWHRSVPRYTPMIHLERPVAVFLFLLALLWDSSRAFRPTTTTLTMTTTASSSSSSKPLRSVAETISTQRWKQTGDIVQRTTLMNERTQALAPLTDDELDDILFSIQNLQSTKDDVDRLRQVLKETAHLSHKDWAVTEANGQLLAQVLLPDGVDGARPLLHRVLTEGNWDAAVQHAKTKSSKEPSWAVLVTGVNGIRKTTSLYQSWFPQLLEEALVAPAYGDNHALTRDQLPSGQNSFFRQLDHMIATLCNEDFLFLYQLTADCLDKDDDDDDDALAKYAELKAAIFGRYRTLSELLGGALLKEAQARRANCLMETSGRDVAMFHYVNHFFPDNKAYKKMALHFTINDLSHACESVDRRMQGELEAGLQALKAASATDIVQANAGGPYGSAVLSGVQEASDKVWETQILPADSPVAADWYKATIQINAHATGPWTAQAVRPDGSLGTVFTFSPKE